jgi:hypothetical protein
MMRRTIPTGFLDKNGSPIRIAGLKVGDVIYRKLKRQLVAMTVTKLNPFTAQTGHGS